MVALGALAEDDRRDLLREGHLPERRCRQQCKNGQKSGNLLVHQSVTAENSAAVHRAQMANIRQKHAFFCHNSLFVGRFPQYTGWTFLSEFRAFITAPHDGGITVTFEVGDKVIYPNQGLGVVTRIEEKTILGTTCGFYHLRIVANETTVLVPLDNVDGVGLRRAIGDEEVERLFNALGNGKIDNHQNWKGRFKDNSDKMRTGSIYDVADVLKSLTLLSRSKSLSFREKRMLDRAKFLIVSEISEVMRETAESIEGRVEKALERSFATRTRAIARAKAAKATPAPRACRRAPGSSGIVSSSIIVSVSVMSGRRLALQDPPFLLYAFLRSMSTLIAAIRSIAAYVAVSLYVAIAAPIGMALALTFRWKSLLYVLGHWGVAIGTSLAGIRTRVAGREHLRAGEAVVFCCNHQSNIDPPILFQALHPRLHVLFKRELTKLPLLGKAFQIGGFVPDRSPQP